MCRCPGPTCPLLLLRVATPVEAPAGGVHGPPSPRGLLCCYVLLPLRCSQPPGQLAAPPQGVHGRAEPRTQVFGPVGQAGSTGSFEHFSSSSWCEAQSHGSGRGQALPLGSLVVWGERPGSLLWEAADRAQEPGLGPFQGTERKSVCLDERVLA